MYLHNYSAPQGAQPSRGPMLLSLTICLSLLVAAIALNDPFQHPPSPAGALSAGFLIPSSIIIPWTIAQAPSLDDWETICTESPKKQNSTISDSFYASSITNCSFSSGNKYPSKNPPTEAISKFFSAQQSVKQKT